MPTPAISYILPWREVKAEGLSSRGGGLLINNDKSSGQGCGVLIQVVIWFSVSRETNMNSCSKTSAMRVNRYQLCYVWDSPMHCNLDLQHVTGPGRKIVSSWAFCASRGRKIVSAWAFCTSRATGGSDAALSGEILNAFITVSIAACEAQPGGYLGELAGYLKLETPLLRFSVPCKSFGVLSMLPRGNLLQPQ